MITVSVAESERLAQVALYKASAANKTIYPKTLVHKDKAMTVRDR